MSCENFVKNGRRGNKGRNGINDFITNLKVIKADNSIGVGDSIVGPTNMDTDVKRPGRPDLGRARISGASTVYEWSLMELGNISASGSIRIVGEWEKNVMRRKFTIPVGEDGKTMGGELLSQAVNPDNEGYFGTKTHSNAIKLERELRNFKGETMLEESIPYKEGKAVVIVHSNDWTVARGDDSIIRVDQRRVGGEIDSLAYFARRLRVEVNARTLKKDVYKKTKITIELAAENKPIYDVSFKGNKAIVEPKGVVHVPR